MTDKNVTFERYEIETETCVSRIYKQTGNYLQYIEVSLAQLLCEDLNWPKGSDQVL